MGRALTFWTDENIQFIKKNFVAASVPTWVCRTETPEGEFLRSADVHKQWITSSGYMTCLSASGKRLGTKPNAAVLAAFRELPAEERAPGAVKVRDLKPSERAIPTPPEGGLVLRVHGRFLARDRNSQLRAAKSDDFPLFRKTPRALRTWGSMLEPNTEYMWLTQSEWKSFVPKRQSVGHKWELDRAIAERMARFHLTPRRATTSEGGIVSARAVKTAELSLAVTELTPSKLTLTLTGKVHWGTDYEESKATTPNGPLKQGYSTRLHGIFEYDRKSKKFVRIDIIAPGDVWGRWGDANGKSMYVERPGRTPFGFAFELATGNTPTDRIPPGGNGRYIADQTRYFGSPRK